MRALRATIEVIALAGRVKNENKSLSEEEVIVCAITDINEPKFLKQDLIQFQAIMRDMFPEVDSSSITTTNPV